MWCGAFIPAIRTLRERERERQRETQRAFIPAIRTLRERERERQRAFMPAIRTLMRFRLDNVPSFGPYAEIQETTCGAYLCSHGHGLATSKLKVEMYTSRILLEIYNSSKYFKFTLFVNKHLSLSLDQHRKKHLLLKRFLNFGSRNFNGHVKCINKQYQNSAALACILNWKLIF